MSIQILDERESVCQNRGKDLASGSRRIVVLVWVLALAVVGAACVSVDPARQDVTGSIQVSVVDEGGYPLPGVTVEISSPKLGQLQTEITDANGKATFASLRKGSYRLLATLPGFSSVETEQVRVGTPLRRMVQVDVVLRTAFTQEILVTSASSAYSGLARPSTGGTTEPNDQPYGDVFFEDYGVNPFIDTEDDPLSTFAVDVDTGAYTVARRYLLDGYLPPREAIRVEEFVNYFDYGDPAPTVGDFALAAEGCPSPFGEGQRYYMVRFSIKGRAIEASDRPPALLIFVVDVSGSMDEGNRLGLVKRSLFELLDHLRPDDRVGLVIYGSEGEVLLEPSTDHEAIRSAVDRLEAGGSTNAEEGLVLAYDLAARFRRNSGINRVILCSDGVANVGRTGADSILKRIGEMGRQGVELTTVGFGMGNYNDELMEQLADAGNGRYAYVDRLSEARRLFVEELTGTLVTIARDAKIQVRFNPDMVSRYRLLGYENRDLDDEEFLDDTVDAGEIGAGHAVTALYEIKLHRFAARKGELATLRLRYHPWGEETEPAQLEHTIRREDLVRDWDQAPASLRLATLVAEYGEILKDSYWARKGDLGEVLRRLQRLAPELGQDRRVIELQNLVAEAWEITQMENETEEEWEEAAMR